VKGQRKRWISYSLTLIFSPLHYLGGFELDLNLALDLDPNGGERKLDLGLLTCFFLIIPLFSYGFFVFLPLYVQGGRGHHGQGRVDV
jgi:hypothetical protein